MTKERHRTMFGGVGPILLPVKSISAPPQRRVERVERLTDAKFAKSDTKRRGKV
jgi:hypothetical protein